MKGRRYCGDTRQLCQHHSRFLRALWYMLGIHRLGVLYLFLTVKQWDGGRVVWCAAPVPKDMSDLG